MASPNLGQTTPLPPGSGENGIGTRMKREIRDIGIPPRPKILSDIERELASDDPDFIMLARILTQDVAISASLLKIANSPYFSLGKKVPTVQEALLVLGLNLIVNTVGGLALRQVFKHVPNMERFWDNSANCALVSGWLARQIGTRGSIRPEDAYTFALLRDCGMAILMIPFPEYKAILGAANNERERSFTAIEDEAIGINHTVVGAELASDWLLPEVTCLAIRHHHDLDHGESNSALALPEEALLLGAIAQLAEYLLQQKTGLGMTHEWEKLGAACLTRLGLDDAGLTELTAAFMANNLLT